MPVHEFQVQMTCTGCSGAVEKVLSKLGSQVQDVIVDLENKRVLVTSDLSGEELLAIIKKTGKDTTYVGTRN